MIRYITDIFGQTFLSYYSDEVVIDEKIIDIDGNYKLALSSSTTILWNCQRNWIDK